MSYKSISPEKGAHALHERPSIIFDYNYLYFLSNQFEALN